MPITLARKPFSRDTAPPSWSPNFLDRMFGLLERAFVPQSVKLVDSAYVAPINDQTITVDASAAGVTVSLPDPSRVAYVVWTIKKVDASANAVTIGATVDGVANPTLATRWKSMTVQSDGATYLKIAAV
jgi:hypothetical protein